jgi:hypothetical protein
MTALKAWPLIDLTAEGPVRDIARAHELVIDVTPDVAGPVTAALTPECILSSCWRTTFQAKGEQIHASNFTGTLPSTP